MGQHVNAQTTNSEYVRAVYNMSGLVENRMRVPWYWNKALYNTFGPGQEHDRCLKTLHDFTVKVSCVSLEHDRFPETLHKACRSGTWQMPQNSAQFHCSDKLADHRDTTGSSRL